jgi:Na+-driven multidrug efflux pump
MVVMGIPMGLQYSITAIGSMVLQSANNGLDNSVYVSGFTAGLRIKQFFMCPFDAIATAVSVFCGQNLGAGKLDRIKKGIRQGVAIGVFYGIAAGLILIFLGRILSLLFLNKDAVDVLDASAQYLRCMGYFFWSLGILNVCRMTVQGIGYSGRTMFSGLTEMIARIVVSLVFVPMFGYQAVCFADQTAWVSACFYIVPTCIICIRKLQRKLSQSPV